MPFLDSFSISSNVLVIFVLLRVLYSQRLKKRQIHLSTKCQSKLSWNSWSQRGLFFGLSFSSTLLLNPETTIKIDKSGESSDLNYEKGQFRHSYGSKFWKTMTYVRPFTVILRKLFILFLPYLRMDQHFKTCGWKSKHQVEPSRKGALVWETQTSKGKLVQQR